MQPSEGIQASPDHVVRQTVSRSVGDEQVSAKFALSPQKSASSVQRNFTLHWIVDFQITISCCNHHRSKPVQTPVFW
ncbi:hypothetical protein RUM4293_03613 [Ruegeria atlantica]|uniref:Uncharacterized protein n=1 Tax=Ruegeria atlantica TaxID=81569 RepID=A0A0P1ESQ7_9RHOB|nr:hypothetical protein RUM4293_03613 [Ruegeria atlantica]